MTRVGTWLRRLPERCYATNGGQVAEIAGVHVEPLLSVLRHHFWVGQADSRAEH